MKKPIKINNFFELYDEKKFNVENSYLLTFIMVQIAVISLPYILIKWIFKDLIEGINRGYFKMKETLKKIEEYWKK